MRKQIDKAYIIYCECAVLFVVVVALRRNETECEIDGSCHWLYNQILYRVVSMQTGKNNNKPLKNRLKFFFLHSLHATFYVQHSVCCCCYFWCRCRSLSSLNIQYLSIRFLFVSFCRYLNNFSTILWWLLIFHIFSNGHRTLPCWWYRLYHSSYKCIRSSEWEE